MHGLELIVSLRKGSVWRFHSLLPRSLLQQLFVHSCIARGACVKLCMNAASCLLLALWAVVAASSGNDYPLNQRSAFSAGFAFAPIDAVF